MNTVAAIAESRPTSDVNTPDAKVSAREAFGLDIDLEVPAFSVRTEHVPDLDTSYQFDRETTLAICALRATRSPRSSASGPSLRSA